MKCITTEQSKEWWTQHYRFAGLPQSCDEWPTAQVLKSHLAFDKNVPISRLHQLGRTFVGWLVESVPDRVLIWVDEHGIWESAQDLHLYYLLRTSHGDHLHLEDGPGHLFNFHEHGHAQSLVSLAISFGWGFYVASSDGRRAIRLDHDGHLLVWAEHASEREAFANAVGILNHG